MLDPVSAAILSGYIANVFSDAALEVHREWREKTFESAPSLSVTAADDSLSRALRDVEISGLLGPGAASTDVTGLTRFLTGRDLGNLAADAMALYLVGEQSAGLSTLRTVCEQSLISYGVSPGPASVASEEILRIVDAVAVSCVESLDSPALKEKERSREAKRRREAAFRRIRERLLTRVENQLAILTTLLDDEHVDHRAIERKIARMREALVQVHGHLTPPGLLDVRQVPIDELYVAPHLVFEPLPDAYAESRRSRALTFALPKPASSAENEHFLVSDDLEPLLEKHERLVVVGTPGAGKTTLSDYIAYRVSTGLTVDEKPEPGSRLSPWSKGYPVLALPVVLRELREPIFSPAGVDIVGAAKNVLLNRYQLPVSRAEIDFLLGSGRILLILDGLDEITHHQDRKAVSTSVDAFAVTYPRCRIVVTSRVVGYRQAPLSSGLFKVATIGPFSAEQVGSYARRWFDLHSDVSVLERRALVASFLAESAGIEDLRENPLLLALICNLYRHQRFIPRNRPEIYASCSRLLFDTWDRSRRLRPAFEFDAHVDGMVQYVAQWVFSSIDRQQGVEEETLIGVAADYLSKWQYRVRQKAESAARDFLHFCRDRAWILTDVGQSPDGERLYGFTHRTFLEYFTATYHTQEMQPDSLVGLFLDKAKEPSWNVVCKLIVQLSSKKEHGLEDRLICALVDFLDGAGVAPSERDVGFTVCVGSLESVPLRPETVEKVVSASLKHYQQLLLTAPNGVDDSYAKVKGRDIYWIESSRVLAENLRVASEVVSETFVDLLREPSKRVRGAKSRYPIAVKALAHLFDFEFGQSARQVSFRSGYPREFSHSMADILRYSREPWVESIALLSGLIIDPVAENSILVRSFAADVKDRRIGPMRLPWGCRSALGLAEIVVWWAINATDDDQTFIEDVLLPRAVAVRDILEVDSISFDPHPTWFAGGPVGPGPRVGAPVELSPDFLSCATQVALKLVEIFVGGDAEAAQPRMADMGFKQWGNLRLVAAAIESRYQTGAPEPSAAELRALTDLGLGRWVGEAGPMSRSV